MKTPKTAALSQRILVLKTANQTLVIEQAVQQQVPVRTLAALAGKRFQLPDAFTLRSLEAAQSCQFTECQLQWLPDLTVTLAPHTGQPPVFQDGLTSETVAGSLAMAGFEDWDATTLWLQTEAAYLAIQQHFSNPYQYADARREALQFTCGNYDELEFGLTMLLHAFPKLYQRALAEPSLANLSPRILVSAAQGAERASYQIRLWEASRRWHPTFPFATLLQSLILANSPVGGSWVNPGIDLCRRQAFVRGPMVLPVFPDAPSDFQIFLAQGFVTKKLAGLGIGVNAAYFNRLPLLPF